jgi:hypothetical protein
MKNYFLLVASFLNRSDDLMNDLHSSFLIGEMWSHWLFSELLDKNVYKAIEDARCVEQIFVLLHCIVGLF